MHDEMLVNAIAPSQRKIVSEIMLLLGLSHILRHSTWRLFGF